MIAWRWDLDSGIVMVGVLCAVSAALVGNFLVLRRMSMLGDAISHAVLPGLALAFVLSGSRNSWYMFAGAVVVGILTAVFTEWIRSIGRVDEGASMGVVFTSLFALGLVMIVQAADKVDLDADCVLYGAIELTPLDRVTVAGYAIPRAGVTLGTVAILNGLFVCLCFKELKISSFDPALATTLGINARIMHYLLMVLVAITAVASFESVGNILVVAMLVVPPAAAYLLTDRLPTMIWLSALLATLAAVGGHVGAIVVPRIWGYSSTTTAGMMAVTAGLIFFLAAVFSPRHGILPRWIRRQLLAWQILADDVVGLLYRMEELGSSSNLPQPNTRGLQQILLSDQQTLNLVLARLRWGKEITTEQDVHALTEAGRQRAQQLVRAHRLWEQYLVSHAGFDTSRIHDKAERLEHFTNPELRQKLDAATDAPQIDPHGRSIPSEHLTFRSRQS